MHRCHKCRRRLNTGTGTDSVKCQSQNPAAVDSRVSDAGLTFAVRGQHGRRHRYLAISAMWRVRGPAVLTCCGYLFAWPQSVE